MKVLKTILFSFLALVIIIIIAGLSLISGIKRGAIPNTRVSLLLKAWALT